MKKLTLQEAALAACGLDVVPIPRDWTGAAKEEKRKQLAQLQKTSKMIECAAERKELGTIYRNGERTEILDIDPADLIAFMTKQDPSWQVPVQLGGDPASTAGRRPAYRTKLLDLQYLAITEFWENYDPQRAPKSEAIIDWLKNKGATDNAARAIDLIIRPDEGKKGGNIKLKGATPKSLRR